MSILSFRNNYLAKVNARLNAVDVSNAKDTDLLVYGALLKHLENVNKIDVINLEGLRFIETMNSAELDEYALDPSSRNLVAKIFQDMTTLQIIVQHAGLMAAIASSPQWLKLLEQSGYLQTVVQSSIAMNAIASSSAGKNLIATNGNLVSNAKTYSVMGSVKILACMAGLNPADYNTLADITTDTVAAKMATTPYCTDFILNATSFDSFKVNSVFCAKTLASKLNLNPNSFADMAVFAATPSAITALCDDISTLRLAANMNAALVALFSNYTIRTAFWNSDKARTAFIDTPNSFNYLLSIAGNALSIGGTLTGAKKIWQLRFIASGNPTGGYITFKFLNNGVSTEATLNAPFPSDGNLPSYYAKQNGFNFSNGVSGGVNNSVYLSYIQMEA